jgi:hypothetical protein
MDVLRATCFARTDRLRQVTSQRGIPGGAQLEKRIDALAGGVRVGVGQDGPNEVAEVELDGPPPAIARLEGLAVQRRKGRPLRGPPEGIYLRCQGLVTVNRL